MNADEIAELDGVGLSAAIHGREFSCREVMRAYLSRIDTLNPKFNALVSLQPREALLAQADQRDAQLARGESLGWMHGFPMAIKDLSAAAGVVMTKGSPLLAAHVPSHDSLIVERMNDAERLPTPEFGHAAAPAGEEPADPLGSLMARHSAADAAAAAATAAGKPVPPPPVVTARIDPDPPSAPTPKAPPLKPSGTIAAAKTDRFIVIALDPGHGGEDPGAIGPGGTHEKDVVLQIAHRLRDRINATTINGPHGRMGLRAYLTRDADFFVPLAQRVVKARKVQADLFVSIHADSFVNADASGASVYALSERGATSTTARWLANKENRADLVGGMNVHSGDAHLHRALVDMSTTAQVNDSLRLGGALLTEIDDVGKLHKPRVEQAGFAVLKAPDIPSVLIETGFISNPNEERNLKSARYQERLAEAVLRGITRYFSNNPPLARNRML